MAIGIITGSAIGKNRDGDVDRVILQVEILADDIQTVEMISQAGEDTHPGIGCRVFVVDADGDDYKVGVAITDDLTPEVLPGEKEFYSTDDPVTTKLARLKLDAAGLIQLNGNVDFAVRFNALKTEFDQFKSDYNSHTHIYSPGPSSPIATAVPVPVTTADITPAKVDEVKLP